MTTPVKKTEVKPSEIEGQLQKIWEKLSEEKKTRASTLNLIVVSKASKRTDYLRNIVNQVVEKFPCRIIFISEDGESKKDKLETSVSVIFPKNEGDIACDQIDIGVSGKSLEVVPFIILPHLTPDLPIYLLWAEDPSQDHPLYMPLLKISTRVIFDSECATDLLSFSNKLLTLKNEMGIDVGDLNWARMQGWRDLIFSTFDTKERNEQLYKPSKVSILYNCQKTDFFSHLKIQAVYLLSWLSSRLNWKIEKTTKELQFEFLLENQKIEAEIKSEQWEKSPPGAILSSEFQSSNGFVFSAKRDPEHFQNVKIEISTQEKCELPYQFMIGQIAVGQSLVREICSKGTSSHFLGVLENLKTLDKDKLC